MLVAVTLLALSVGEVDLKLHQETLRGAGFGGDGPGAIAYLKALVPDPERLAALRVYLKQLGDEDYDRREAASRELRKAGPVMLADLKVAAESSDAEVRRRARELLEIIQQHSPAEVVVAACGVIAASRPKDADAVLLKFAPFVSERVPELAFLDAVGTLGLTPAVRAALEDADPLRRRAAVRALDATPDAPRELLTRALKDTDARVKFEAARGLVLHGDRAGLALLVETVGQGELSLALRAEDLLWRLAREQSPPVLLKTAADREPVQTGWEKWFKEHGSDIDLARIRLDEKERGWVVVCDDEEIGKAPGSVKVFDLKGARVKTLEKLDSPSDVVLLPGERMLVAEHWSSKVTERDAQGRILWEHRTTDKPVVALRLADGGTFIATYHEILEVDRTGTVRYSFRPEQGMLYGATKVGTGRILFINGSGNVCEADRTGKILNTFKPEKYAEGAGYWASIEVLGPDRYLLSLSGSNRVVEVDGQGKIFWEAEVRTPTYAMRLPDGTTLASCVDAKTWVVIDKEGKTTQTVEVGGRPFRARRY
jgi:hypothetical protein